jgi:hypothetical protein
VLAEFASVVDAVECGVEIQKELRARNDRVPVHRKMEFRIGINLGDVVEEENKIFGDGVNTWGTGWEQGWRTGYIFKTERRARLCRITLF